MFAHPVIGLIPARSGSKGVEGKNMRPIGGKPLIEFTILAAQESAYIDTVYVSSDDPVILKHAQTIGAFGVLRPAEFAKDTSSATEVVKHFIGTLPKIVLEKDPYLVYLQPTSPLRAARHIDDALEQMMRERAQSLISVSGERRSPFKMFSLDTNGRLQSLFDEKLSNARRQDLPAVFSPNGAIYIFRVSKFGAKGGFPSNGSVPYVMSDSESLDIDTEDDLRVAEMVLGTR